MARACLPSEQTKLSRSGEELTTTLVQKRPAARCSHSNRCAQRARKAVEDPPHHSHLSAAATFHHRFIIILVSSTHVLSHASTFIL